MIALGTEKSILYSPTVGLAGKANIAAGFVAATTSKPHHTTTVIPRQFRAKAVADSELI